MNYAAQHPVSRVPENVRLLKTTVLLKAAKNMVQNKKGRPMNLAATFPYPFPPSPFPSFSNKKATTPGVYCSEG